MRLGKFGAILKFAIDLEQRTIEFYDAAAGVLASQEMEDSAGAARRRLASLQRMRRELVNEMLLEPIAGFESPELPEVAVVPQAGAATEKARLELEQARDEFYTAAAAKVATVAPSLSKALERMARDSQSR